MNKLITTFKSINKLGLAMIALTAITLMSFKATESKLKNTDVVWVQTSEGDWEELLSNDYICDQSENVCSASYPVNQDPNLNPSGGTPIDEDGFATIISR